MTADIIVILFVADVCWWVYCFVLLKDIELYTLNVYVRYMWHFYFSNYTIKRSKGPEFVFIHYLAVWHLCRVNLCEETDIFLKNSTNLMVEKFPYDFQRKTGLFFEPVDDITRKAKLKIKNRWTDIDICFHVGSKRTQPSALKQN